MWKISTCFGCPLVILFIVRNGQYQGPGRYTSYNWLSVKIHQFETLAKEGDGNKGVSILDQNIFRINVQAQFPILLEVLHQDDHL